MSPPLPRVTNILPAKDWSRAPIDTVVLDYEDRYRRRVVLKGLKGTRVLLELAEPTLLMDGDGLRLDSGEVVAVEAAAESLAEISCYSEHAMVRVAWHLGNRHLPIQILQGKLRIREDHVIVAMVEQLGASVRLIKAPFQPEGGAYGSGVVHGHDHGHGHGESHGAHAHD